MQQDSNLNLQSIKMNCTDFITNFSINGARFVALLELSAITGLQCNDFVIRQPVCSLYIDDNK